jgi:hypothetical protein
MKDFVDKVKDEVKVIIIFLFLFLIYIGFVGLWKITSPNYQPINLLDSEPHQDIDPKLWVNSRNQHGQER